MHEEVQVLIHSCIRIEGEKTIYFDPFRLEEEIYDADIVFITHEHMDHFSPEDIKRVEKEDTVFIAPKSMEKRVNSILKGEQKAFYLSPNEKTTILGLEIETIPAYNVAKPFHEKTKGWLGYIVTMGGTRYFICGDSDKTVENRKVKCDVAMVPIGGLYTMDAKEAARLINEMKPAMAIPVHYGSIVGTKWDAVTFFDNLSPDIEARA